MLKSSPYTHNQLAVMQDNGAATSAFVGAHVIGAAMDTESAVVSLFEQWIPELSPEAVECFRVLQTEYTAPKDLAWMLSRREAVGHGLGLRGLPLGCNSPGPVGRSD